jgi:hypothetical protein
LPLTMEETPCTFEIISISSMTLSVISSTGDVRAAAYVAPHGCPLTSGEVSVWLRFIPLAAKSNLSVKVIKCVVTVPAEWTFVAWFAGKNPKQQIQKGLEKIIAGLTFKMPSADHVHAAFQGVSLDTKLSAIILRIRLDAQIDQPAIMEILSGSEQIKNLSINYP